MTDVYDENRIPALSQALRQRGLDAAEVDTICGLVAYMDGVDQFPESILGADLPLAYEAPVATGKGPAP